MNIQIKKSIKPVKYNFAIEFLEKRVSEVKINKSKELIWILEHEDIYTAGTSFNEKEILDKSINIVKTNRGGKITYHGPGQIICYFVIDLNKRKRDIRNFVNLIEKTIIETLKEYNVQTFSDKKNIGIWYNNKNSIQKVAAIGIRVSKWIAYHGFSINIENDLTKYENIVPCGIYDKGVTNLKKIKTQSYKDIKKKIIKNFVKNLKI